MRRLLAAATLLALPAATLAPDAVAQARSTTARVAVPAGTYTIDPAHSNLNFSVSHFGLADVTGDFRNATGTITVGTGGLSTLRATASFPTNTIDTGVEARDEHLRSADFFDVERFPTATFESTRVSSVRGRYFRLHGNLTMHGVTRPVTLDASFKGTAQQPEQMGGKQLVGFTGRTTIRRADFGITYGPDMIGRDVVVVINVEAQKQ